MAGSRRFNVIRDAMTEQILVQIVRFKKLVMIREKERTHTVVSGTPTARR